MRYEKKLLWPISAMIIQKMIRKGNLKNQLELAKLLGLNTAGGITNAKYSSNKKEDKIPAEWLVTFNLKTGIPISEILGAEETEKSERQKGDGLKRREIPSQITTDGDKNYIPIPFKEEIPLVKDPFLKVLALKDWLRQQVTGRLEDAFMMVMDDDSMIPRYRSGDILFVDGIAFRPEDGQDAPADGVYIVKMKRLSMRPRRLQFYPDGKIEITAENVAIKPILVDPEKDQIQILGKVVWHARRD